MRATILCLGLTLLAAGCGRGDRETVSVLGSTSVQPFAEMLAEVYNEERAGQYVEVQGGGSAAGIEAIANGIAAIGMCSRALKDDEARNYQATLIARDGLAVVVNRGNPVANLSLEQARRIFAGEITNWKDVGGEDAPIWVITREEGSGTREAFTKAVMGKTRIFRKALTQESNGAVKELVRNGPGGIGYMSLGLVQGELKSLTIDGVAPTAEGVMDGTYPLARPFLFVSKGELKGAAAEFVRFVLSEKAQEMLEKEGLVRAR